MRIIKQEITCPKCKGSGRVFDVAECVFTAGISFVLGAIDSNLKDVCPKCGGNGTVYRKIKIKDNNERNTKEKN